MFKSRSVSSCACALIIGLVWLGSADPSAADDDVGAESFIGKFFGAPAIGFEGGKGSSELESVRLFVQSHWDHRRFDEGRWYLTGYWELDYSRWETERIPREEAEREISVDSTEVVGFTPVFRIVQKRIFSLQTKAYLEGAVGFHYMEDTFIGDKNASSNFQFGDHVGLGVIFGDKNQFDLSYRLQHYSNGGIDSPNPGLDFHQFRLAVRF